MSLVKTLLVCSLLYSSRGDYLALVCLLQDMIVRARDHMLRKHVQNIIDSMAWHPDNGYLQDVQGQQSQPLHELDNAWGPEQTRQCDDADNDAAMDVDV